MKQDLVYYILDLYPIRDYASARACLKMSKLTKVFYISNPFLLEYTGRQNNN